MKNILVAVDLQPGDDQLVRFAILFAKQFDAKVWLLHITEPEPDFVGYAVGPTYIRDVRADALRSEHRKLQSDAVELKLQGVDAESLLIQGPTVEMLKTEIQKLRADLLIIGSHKHGFMYETFVGHTASKLVGNAGIPILIVPVGTVKDV